MIDKIHYSYIFERRVSVLVNNISELIPQGSSVLDVGCGNGSITKKIANKVGGGEAKGIDVFLREDCQIPVSCFDGHKIPYEDKSVDFVTFVDVLHHTDNAQELLSEANRVARKGVIIKDHLADGVLAYKTLKFMDDIGNKRFGVELPYNFFKKVEWDKMFNAVGLSPVVWKTKLNLYPQPLSLFFDRKLHFVSFLKATE